MNWANQPVVGQVRWVWVWVEYEKRGGDSEVLNPQLAFSNSVFHVCSPDALQVDGEPMGSQEPVSLSPPPARPTSSLVTY